MSCTQDALIEWTAHTIVVAALLFGIWIVEQVHHLLWPDSDRMLFGSMPLSWLFDPADLAILAGFLSYDVIAVIRAYSGYSTQE